MTLETINFPHFPPSLPVYAALYRDVQNASFLRQQLLSGNADFEYAFVDATVIFSRAHILSAVFRAINDYSSGRMRSRNAHSEIVFSLSPTNNIAESFRRFGITDSTTDLLVIKVPVNPGITYESVTAHLAENVKGTGVPFSNENLSEISDVGKIKKIYKLGALAPQSSKAAQVNGENGENDERRLLEIALQGAIALRGAT